MAIDESLERLAGAWAALPSEVRSSAGESLAIACAVLAEAVKVLGARAPALIGPAMAVASHAMQDVLIWQRPFEGPGGIAERIEARFPAAVTLLKALAPDPPPAPPPDAQP